jgi:hypothetical protein
MTEEIKQKTSMLIEHEQILHSDWWKWYCSWLDAAEQAIGARFNDTVSGEDFTPWSLNMWHKHGEVKGIARVRRIPDEMERYLKDGLPKGDKEDKGEAKKRNG